MSKTLKLGTFMKQVFRNQGPASGRLTASPRNKCRFEGLGFMGPYPPRFRLLTPQEEKSTEEKGDCFKHGSYYREAPGAWA